MQSDGSVIIDTKILDGGLEKGFEAIRDEMETVGVTAEKTGEKIKLSFSRMDISKPIAAAADRVKDLEAQLERVTAEAREAKLGDDDSAAMRLENQRLKIYDQLEQARRKLEREIIAAAQKEADAEAKEAARTTKAKKRELEKQSKAAQKEAERQQQAAMRPLRRFGSRFREILSGALVFNALSAGLRAMTQYFGAALKSNQQFTASFAKLKGALLTAFQPIYEVVLPALIALMRVLTAVVQVIGQFFAAITGKSTAQMAENAEALHKEANAISGVGGAAKKAKRELAGFDEINKLSGANQNGGGSGGGGSGVITPDFEAIELTDSLKHILYLVGAIGAALLAWKVASAFTDNLKTIAGIALAVGGAVLFAFNWIDAFNNGIDWTNLAGMIAGVAAAAGGLYLAFGAVGAGIALLIGGLALVVLAMREWITTGELTNEACAALVLGIVAIGGAISLFTGSWIPVAIAAIVGFVIACVTKSEEMKAALEKFNNWLQNIFKKDFTELFGPVLGGVLNILLRAFGGLWDGVTGILSGLIDFIGGVFTADWRRAWEGFLGIIQGIVDAINGIIDGIISGFQSAINAGKRLLGIKTQTSTTSVGGGSFGTARTIATPEVPALARGAVIPPNAPFMAMLGDQRHGTNIEAPLSTIQEAVALVMEDYAAANLAGHEATVAVLRDILEAVLGIEIGDDVLGKAANRYNARLATMRGDA